MAVLAAACVWLVGFQVHGAAAEDWPARPVKIIVPYGPGGISDVLARMTADRLSVMFGQRFIIETHPGANGAIGTEDAVRSPPDGYTLYHAGGAEFSVVPLMQKLSYDPVKDLTPISMTAINGMALVVNRDLPVRSVQDSSITPAPIPARSITARSVTARAAIFRRRRSRRVKD